MIYPNFIKENDTIGVTAPSDGITDSIELKRLDLAKENFNKLNFKVKETDNVRKSEKGRSSSSIERARQLEALFLDKDVKAIICASGGEFLVEMLPNLDFEVIKNNPKWVQGYSDPTGLLYYITTSLDIATIYGSNFKTFAMNPWHASLFNNLELLKGNMITQESFKKYEKDRVKYITGDEQYNLSCNVQLKTLNYSDKVNIRGRIIGGCMDVISDIFGTRFDKSLEYIDKYKEDGIIWYFDICDLASENIIRTLWKFKDSGMFKYCSGIIFGRIYDQKSCYDISFEEALTHSLGDLNIPIIINADVGHVPPRITMINGAIAEVISSCAKGSIKFYLE